MSQEKKDGNVIDITELYRQRDSITMEKGSRGDEQTDEEELRAEALAQEETEDDEEYEYVPLSEVSNGVGAKIIGFLQEYYMIVAIVLVVGVCLLLSQIGQNVKSIFIAIAFGVLVLGGAYILYEAWQDKKRADREYRHARSVIEPVKKKMKEEREKQ